jgi:hypothetical protein
MNTILTSPSTLLLTFSLVLVCQVGCEMPEVDQHTPIPVVENPSAENNSPPENIEPAQPQEFTANDPKRGKRSRAVGGYAGAVFGARFWAEHQMIINNIKHALDLYNAEHGNYPKTHEEFMEKIIATNQIALPELDEGQEYLYDPEDHTLKFRAIEPDEDIATQPTEDQTTQPNEDQTTETDEEP